MMRRCAVVLALLIGVSTCADAQISGAFGDPMSGGLSSPSGGSGGGLSATLHVSGYGETPTVRVEANTGERVLVTVSYAYTGNTMFSGADVAKTALVATDTVSSYTGLHYLPQEIRAFDGDEIQIWMDVTFVDQGGDNVELTDTFTVDIPNVELQLAIVQSVDHDAANCTSSLYAAYAAAGADVYTYGDGGDLPMAYVPLDRGDWDNVDNYATSGAGAAYLTTACLEDYSLRVAEGDSAQMMLIRCPIESLLGENSTVIEARYNVCGSVDLQQSPNDTLVAILDEVPTDNLWWAAENQGGWNGRDGAAFAGYRYQVQGYDDAVDAANATILEGWGAPGASAGAWDWPSRIRYEDVGRYQFTSEPHPSRGFASTGYRWLDGDWFGWRINRLVQHAHNGATNNGILYAIRDGDEWQLDMNLRYPGTYHSYSGLDHEMPFYVLAWIEGAQYQPVLPLADNGEEAECLFVFSSDDGVLDANDHYSDVFEDRGCSYSIYMQQQYVGVGSYAGLSDLRRYHDTGHEIGNHGYRGYSQAAYDTTGVAAALHSPTFPLVCEPPDSAGNFAEQVKDFNACWLYDDTIGLGPSYTNDPRVGKTHSVNLGTTTLPALLAADRAGALGARRIGIKRAYRSGSFPAGGWLDFFSELSLPSGAAAATATDTTYATFPVHDLLKPFNYMATLNTLETENLVGDEEASPDSATVVDALRNRLTAYTGLNLRLLSLYSHAEKNHGYVNGITAEELGWVLDGALDWEYVKAMNWRDFQSWRRGLLLQAETPSTWGNYEAWKSPRETGIWGRLKWLDAAKMQGIKRQGS